MATFRERGLKIVEATQLSFSALFTSGDGDTVQSNPGDWIVTENYGTDREEQCIMDCAEFEATYEPLKKQGRKAGTRNKSREEVESAGDAACVDGAIPAVYA